MIDSLNTFQKILLIKFALRETFIGVIVFTLVLVVGSFVLLKYLPSKKWLTPILSVVIAYYGVVKLTGSLVNMFELQGTLFAILSATLLPSFYCGFMKSSALGPAGFFGVNFDYFTKVSYFCEKQKASAIK